MDEHALRVLEFGKVLERLAGHCSFSAGRELALELRPSTDRRDVVRRQRITAEARRLVELRPNIGLGGVHNVHSQVDKASRGGELLPNELLDVASTLSAAADLQATVRRVADELPLLAALTREFEPLPELVSEINRCITPVAEVADGASPKLALVRRQVRVSHDRLHERLQSMLRSSAYRDAIQEPIVTQRDGRYVIPVKADKKGDLPGIVHDVSASGATLFVEPLSVVDLGNDWREAQLDEQREIERILRELSGLVGESADGIIATIEALAEFDLALAKARLGDSLRAYELPQSNSEQSWLAEAPAELRLLNARHPLLGAKAVPVTFQAGGDTRVMLITGPNTGGKTVALKTAGLLVAMAQSGLPVPADRASQVPVFESIYADIGDEQSIEQSLSTFSSHMTNIIRILDSANTKSLVLLDELAAGTDPVEGSALAQAVLGRLLDLGCVTIATTHHGELKAYAHATPGVVNAAVEFDPETLMPTYHVTIGLPGRSNALAIAERLGLSHDLIEAARAAIAPDTAQVESLLKDIRRERDEAAAARLAEEQARGAAEDARAEIERQRAATEEHLDTLVEKTADELERDAAAVRELLSQAERQAEQGEVNEAAQRLAEALERRKEMDTRRPRKKPPKRAPADGGPSPEEILPGDLVWVKGYDRFGEALTTPDERGEVELRLGPLRGRTRLEQVERVQRPKARSERGQAQAEAGIINAPAPDAPPLEIEVRGQTVDEALPQVEQYLDRAYRAGLPWVRIVHGKGTGTLRRQVRSALSKHPLVRSYETGKLEEGGEGVTVAHLAES
jgi:DNA mismatch repair protein MutS2